MLERKIAYNNRFFKTLDSNPYDNEAMTQFLKDIHKSNKFENNMRTLEIYLKITSITTPSEA